jgi:hypothetical protein
MSSKDIAIFEAVASDWLRHYGYDVAGTNYKIKWYERSFYESEEILRKIIHTLSYYKRPERWRR